MNLHLMKTLKYIEKILAQDRPNLEELKKAYTQTLKLRSQLISVIYDAEQYVEEKKERSEKLTVSICDKKSVTLVIDEPLPSKKELTATVEEHWTSMIHNAIAVESQSGIPKFQKAFVMIEITTPRGSNNRQVWDTSNRAINVIINNLKGIFFKDDDFEHMSCGITAEWGENAETVIKICEFDEHFKANLDKFFDSL